MALNNPYSVPEALGGDGSGHRYRSSSSSTTTNNSSSSSSSSSTNNNPHNNGNDDSVHERDAEARAGAAAAQYNDFTLPAPAARGGEDDTPLPATTTSDARAMGYASQASRSSSPEMRDASAVHLLCMQLHEAVHYGEQAIAMTFIDKGADIEHRAPDGLLPIHRALWRGHCRLANDLIDRGANIHTTVTHDAGGIPLPYPLPTLSLPLIRACLANARDRTSGRTLGLCAYSHATNPVLMGLQISREYRSLAQYSRTHAMDASSATQREADSVYFWKVAVDLLDRLEHVEGGHAVTTPGLSRYAGTHDRERVAGQAEGSARDPVQYTLRAASDGRGAGGGANRPNLVDRLLSRGGKLLERHLDIRAHTEPALESAFDVALESRCIDFVAHPTVQRHVNDMWDNDFAGGLAVLPQFLESLRDCPFFYIGPILLRIFNPYLFVFSARTSYIAKQISLLVFAFIHLGVVLRHFVRDESGDLRQGAATMGAMEWAFLVIWCGHFLDSFVRLKSQLFAPALTTLSLQKTQERASPRHELGDNMFLWAITFVMHASLFFYSITLLTGWSAAGENVHGSTTSTTDEKAGYGVVTSQNAFGWMTPRNMLALSLPPVWAILAYNVLRLSQSFGSLLNVLGRLLLPMSQFLLLLVSLMWVFSLTMHLLLSEALDIEFGSLPSSMYFIVKTFFRKFDFETFDHGRAGGGSFTGPALVVAFLVSTNLYLVRVLIAMLTLTYNKFDKVSTQENLFARTMVVMESRDLVEVPPVPLNLVSGPLGYLMGPACCGCRRRRVQRMRMVANYVMIWVPFVICTLPITLTGLLVYLSYSLGLRIRDACPRQREQQPRQPRRGHGERRFSLQGYRAGNVPSHRPLFGGDGVKSGGVLLDSGSGGVAMQVLGIEKTLSAPKSVHNFSKSSDWADAIKTANMSPAAPHEQHTYEMNHRHLAMLRKKRLSNYKRRLTWRSWVAQNFGGQASVLLRRQSRSKWDDSSNVFHEQNLESVIAAAAHAKKHGSAADAHAHSTKELGANAPARKKHKKKFAAILAKNKRLKILMLLESALEFGDAMSADARLVHIQQIQERHNAKLRRELFAIRSKLTQVIVTQSRANNRKVGEDETAPESHRNPSRQRKKARNM